MQRKFRGPATFTSLLPRPTRAKYGNSDGSDPNNSVANGAARRGLAAARRGFAIIGGAKPSHAVGCDWLAAGWGRLTAAVMAAS